MLEFNDKLPLRVNADNEKIQQVLTNLIENSIKYGKENGTTELVIQELTENKIIVRHASTLNVRPRTKSVTDIATPCPTIASQRKFTRVLGLIQLSSK